MLLVNSNSEVRNCFRIVLIFFLKQSVDIVLAMNASMLTEPMKDWKTCWCHPCWSGKDQSGNWWFPINCCWSKICYVQHLYSTVIEHFVTQQWFKHYHFVSGIQTCRKRCWEKLYNINLRYYDCWKTRVCVLVTSVHFSWYQWFTGESIHVSELQVATAAQMYNLAPCMNSAWYDGSLML